MGRPRLAAIECNNKEKDRQLKDPPLNSNNNEEHYKVLIDRQTKMIRTMILPEIMLLLQ